MNFLLAPRKDDKYPRNVLWLHYRMNFKCIDLGIQARVTHVDGLKLENGKQPLSHSGSSVNAHSIIIALSCKAIGSSTGARVGGWACFGKGSSSSNFSEPLIYIGSASNNLCSLAEDDKGPAEMKSSMFQTIYLATAAVAFVILLNSQGPVLLLHPVTLELQRVLSMEILLPLCSHLISLNVALVSPWTPSVECHHSDLSICQMLQLTFLVACFTLPLRWLNPALGLNLLYMFKHVIPMKSPPLCIHASFGLVQFEAKLPLLKYPVCHNYIQGKNASRASMLNKSGLIVSSDSSINNQLLESPI